MSEAIYVFQIPDADSLYCHFDGVGILPIALVKIYDEAGVHRYSITFFTPGYIKCPLKWKGANFRLATPEEMESHLASVPIEVRESWTDKGLNFEEKFFEQYSLFVVDVDTDTEAPVQIQFLAEKAELHQKG
jgi:hypothetical protein